MLHVCRCIFNIVFISPVHVCEETIETDIQMCWGESEFSHTGRIFFFIENKSFSNIYSGCHKFFFFFSYSECTTKVTLSSNAALNERVVSWTTVKKTTNSHKDMNLITFALFAVVQYVGISVAREIQQGYERIFHPSVDWFYRVWFYRAALQEVFVGGFQSHERVTRPSSKKCYSHYRERRIFR